MALNTRVAWSKKLTITTLPNDAVLASRAADSGAAVCPVPRRAVVEPASSACSTSAAVTAARRFDAVPSAVPGNWAGSSLAAADDSTSEVCRIFSAAATTSLIAVGVLAACELMNATTAVLSTVSSSATPVPGFETVVTARYWLWLWNSWAREMALAASAAEAELAPAAFLVALASAYRTKLLLRVVHRG